jgi:CRISPR system Cascade subunit CasA
MYHTLLRGKNLIESIHLNLIPKNVIMRHYGKFNGDAFWGRPIWEMPPEHPEDKVKITNATQTYLGRLLPMCRWIKIQPAEGSFHCGNGFDYPKMDKKVKKAKKGQPVQPVWPAEPTASVVMNKEKTARFVKGAKPDKTIWRELAALLIKRNEDSLGGPLAFENPLPVIGFDIHVCALVRDQGSIENMVESVFHVSPKMFTEEGRCVYETEVEEAEGLSRKLGYAIGAYRKNVDIFWDRRVEMAGKDRKKLEDKLCSKATRTYWTAIEKQRHLLMSYVDVFNEADKYEAAQKTWRTAIHKSARDAYISACGQETPRQIRAFALGWGKLFFEKKAKNEIQNNDGGEE